MKKEHIEVMVNILYAVETGGQVYGGRRYDDFTEAYHNSSNEHAITIGAGAWYATEAQRLLKLIRTTDLSGFKQMDNAGIGNDLDNCDWSTYKLQKGSNKAKCIQGIIGSTIGIQCQDQLVREQVASYEKEVQKLGVSDTKAVCMCINLRHLGGIGAVKRVLAKTATPYTMERIWSAMQSDTGNQVGGLLYRTRHQKVMGWLNQYVTEEVEESIMGATAQDYLNVWRSWIGFSEANGKFRQIIDLYNSVKPLPRGYAVQYTDEWCDTTVSAAGIKAGCTDLIGRECGCEEHVKIFKSLGIWNEDGTITPEPGYIIVYNWDKATQPNDGYSDHIGVVESVSNGQITCIEGNKGETVARRVLSVGNGYIRGYASPKFARSSSSGSTGTTPAPAPSTGDDVSRTVAWYGVVNTGCLNVRTWAGTENAQLKSYPTISQGTKVGVCDTVKDKDGDPWYFVKISGNQGDKYGFVSAAYITKQNTSTPTADSTLKDDGVITKTPQWVGKVTADTLNVRTWAGVNNPTIKSWPQLSNGNLVDVCDVVNAADGSPWYYIRIDGRIYGFVHSAYIAKA